MTLAYKSVASIHSNKFDSYYPLGSELMLQNILTQTNPP